MTALVVRRTCENCGTVLVPYGAEACWSCGGPSRRVAPAEERNQRTVEVVSLGGAIGASIGYWAGSSTLALVGGAIGAAVFGLGALVRVVVIRARVQRELAARAPVLALGAGTHDAAYRARLDAVEREVVALLDRVAVGLRANADAVAARGGTSPALDQARATLGDVRAQYEAHLANTLVASELVAVAAWLRRMSALASLPTAEPEQARAVLAGFDRDLAAARSPAYAKRAQIAASADPSIQIVVRESYPALGIRAELGATLPPRFAEAWTRALDSAAPLRSVLADQLELAAVRAAADVASQVRLIDNPEQPALALTATANVVTSLEDEVARLLEESDRIRAEADAMREVEAALA
jgi:hypothetical protein